MGIIMNIKDKEMNSTQSNQKLDPLWAIWLVLCIGIIVFTFGQILSGILQ